MIDKIDYNAKGKLPLGKYKSIATSQFNLMKGTIGKCK
jgi:hypothetical protein